MKILEINRIYIPIYIRILPRILYPANISCKRIYSGIYILGDIYPTQVWPLFTIVLLNAISIYKWFFPMPLQRAACAT